MPKQMVQILFFVLILSYSSFAQTYQTKETIVEGNISLDVYDFKGFEKLLKLKDDKIHVVNFWATWCVPCVKELPYFDQLNAQYDDVEVLLVSMDFKSSVKKSLIPFIEERKLLSRVILLDDPDENTWIPKIDKNWTGAIPATIIYNKDKSSFYERSFNFEELEKEILKFKN